jgi:hypothetical protein
MTIARDVLAETNPAFCSVVFAQFCLSYQKAQDTERAPALPLIYLILPIVISEELAHTFDGCNKDTGLAVWLNRSPKVIAELSRKVNSTLDITTGAIRFGCITGTLHLTNDGDLKSTLKKIPPTVANSAIQPSLSRARLFGAWAATAGSTRAVLEAFGVSV